MSIYKDLTIPVTISDYCAAREKTLALLESAFQAFDLADNELKTVYRYGLKYGSKPQSSFNEIKKQIDRDLWRQAFDKTNLMQLMDSKARKEFENSLDKNPVEFTEDNIRSTFISTMQSADEMFARGLVNVFLDLSNNYETNKKSAFKVERKVIMDYMVSPAWGGGLEIKGYYSRASDRLGDLDRVFKTLDGKPYTARSLETAINGAFKTGTNVYEDEYFKVKGFKKGTLHMEFKRADLLEKANKIIADYYDGNAISKQAA